MSQEVKDLKYFLNPRSIAVIGATSKKRTGGEHHFKDL